MTALTCMKPFGSHRVNFPGAGRGENHTRNWGADRKGKLATIPGKKHRICQAREHRLSPIDHIKRLYYGLQTTWWVLGSHWFEQSKEQLGLWSQSAAWPPAFRLPGARAPLMDILNRNEGNGMRRQHQLSAKCNYHPQGFEASLRSDCKGGPHFTEKR